MSEVDIGFDTSTLMSRAEADATIADLNAKIAAIKGLTLLGNITVTDTALISLALGMKRMAVTLTGVAAGDRLTFAPSGVPTAGVEAVNVYASAANQVTVSYFTPALGIGSSYSIPLSIFRITT